MAVFFKYGDISIDLDDLTVAESEAVDEIVNAGRPAAERESWAVIRFRSSPLHARAVARVCLARTDPEHADERAASLTLRDITTVFVEESDPLGTSTPSSSGNLSNSDSRPDRSETSSPSQT